MKRVLFILGQMDDLDIEWMIDNGHKQMVSYGEKLIVQGENIENIFIILSGEFAIIDENNPSFEIARIGPGEIVGEMSFIDARPPATSVLAIEPASVYAIDRQLMNHRLDIDSEFASRFYFSIALFLSHRMRKTMDRMGYGTLEEDVDEINVHVLNKVAQAGARFGKILNKFSEV